MKYLLILCTLISLSTPVFASVDRTWGEAGQPEDQQIVTEAEFQAMIERITKQPRVWRAQGSFDKDHEVASDMAHILLKALMTHYEIIGYETDYGFGARMFEQLKKDIAEGKIQDGGANLHFFQSIANLDALIKEAQKALEDLERLRTEEGIFTEKDKILKRRGLEKIETIGKSLHVIFIEMMDKVRRASYASGEWAPPLPTPQRVKAEPKTISINQDLFSSTLSYYADTVLDLIAQLKTFNPILFKVADGASLKDARIHPYGFNWYGDDAFYAASEEWLRNYESRDRKFRETIRQWKNRLTGKGEARHWLLPSPFKAFSDFFRRFRGAGPAQPGKPTYVLTNADIEQILRESYRDRGITLSSVTVTDEGEGKKLAVLKWGGAETRIHLVPFEKTFVLADGQSIELAPIQPPQVTQKKSTEHATVNDYLDVFKYDWGQTRQAPSFQPQTEFLANRMGAILFEQLKLRLESLGLTISNPEEVHLQIVALVMQYQSSAINNSEVKELSTAFLTLEEDIRIVEETLEKLRQEFPAEFEHVLTKERVQRLKKICAPAIDVASDIRNHLWMIQYLSRVWITEEGFPVQVNGRRIDVSSESIKLHPWMFHELITYYANRIVDLLDKVEASPTINFKISDQLVPDEFHPRDVFFSSLLPENPNAVKKLRAEVQRFSSQRWTKPTIRPFARWAWERTKGQVRQMRGRGPGKGGLPKAPSARATDDDLRGLGFSIHDHTDVDMSRVRVNPDGTVVVEGESALEAARRGFGEVVNRTAEIIGVKKATGEIDRAEMSGGEVGNGKWWHLRRGFGIRKAK